MHLRNNRKVQVVQKNIFPNNLNPYLYNKYDDMSTFSKTQLHTIRLTGQKIEDLPGIQEYLLNLCVKFSEIKFPKFTQVFGPDRFYLDQPVKLIHGSLDREYHWNEYNKTYQLNQDLNLIEINVKYVQKKLYKYFREKFHYKDFSAEDFNLLMYNSGFSGYYSTEDDVIILFSPELYLDN